MDAQFFDGWVNYHGAKPFQGPTDGPLSDISVGDSRCESGFWCNGVNCFYPWYEKYFRKYPHKNYVGWSKGEGPFCISVRKDTGKGVVYYLIYISKGCQCLCVRLTDLPQWWCPWTYLASPLGKHQEPLQSFTEHLLPQQVFSSNYEGVESDLADIEQKLALRQVNIGILYLGPGQKTVQEALNVKLEDASPGFFEFLEFLGEMVELKGWSGYNGELDTKLGTSGTHSLYTSYCGYEIMFHVAPFLPWRDNDPQQLGRKVRIGNDHLVIVYQEGDLFYDPTTLRSKQTHVICIVKPTDDLYWVNFFARASVPPFPPAWRFPVRLEKNRVSRDRLLEKCINGIKAMYGMPRFQTKLESYRRKMLWDVYGKSIANSHYVQRMGCPL